MSVVGLQGCCRAYTTTKPLSLATLSGFSGIPFVCTVTKKEFKEFKQSIRGQYTLLPIDDEISLLISPKVTLS